jgi:hypothetical protein
MARLGRSRPQRHYTPFLPVFGGTAGTTVQITAPLAMSLALAGANAEAEANSAAATAQLAATAAPVEVTALGAALAESLATAGTNYEIWALSTAVAAQLAAQANNSEATALTVNLVEMMAAAGISTETVAGTAAAALSLALAGNTGSTQPLTAALAMSSAVAAQNAELVAMSAVSAESMVMAIPNYELVAETASLALTLTVTGTSQEQAAISAGATANLALLGTNAEKVAETVGFNETLSMATIATITPLSTAISMSLAVNNSYFVCSIDTMKESKDTQSLTLTQIQQHVTLAASLGVTHIAISTPYDFAANSPNIQAQWATAIHNAGCGVLWRCHFNQWENDWGTTGIMTSAAYITALGTWLTSYGSMIQPGDIFDFCPEPENGLYWANQYGADWSYSPPAPNTATNDYNNFIVNGRSAIRTYLTGQGIPYDVPGGVETRWHSTDSYFAYTPSALYNSTLDGICTVDLYPDAGATSPAAAATALTSQLDQVRLARPGMWLNIGEHGFNSGNVTSNDYQRAVLEAEFAALLQYPGLGGINYWCSVPDIGSAGYCDIFQGSSGAWSFKPAAYSLQAFFLALRKGNYEQTAASSAIAPSLSMSTGNLPLIPLTATIAGTLVLSAGYNQQVGVHIGSGSASATNILAAQLGRPLIVSDYQDATNPSEDDSNYPISNYHGVVPAGTQYVLMVPMQWVNSTGQGAPSATWTLADVAAGSLDTYFNHVFSYLASVSSPSAPGIVRLGQEFNGNTYAWSSKYQTAANYVAAHQHVSNLAHAYGLLVCWNPLVIVQGGDVDVVAWYPGNAYVDILGLDLYPQYYESTGPNPTEPTLWAQYLNASQVFNAPGTGLTNHGLTWYRGFADYHNLPILFCEFGLQGAAKSFPNEGGTGDDPYFIAQAAAWAAEQGAGVILWDSGNYAIMGALAPESSIVASQWFGIQPTEQVALSAASTPHLGLTAGVAPTGLTAALAMSLALAGQNTELGALSSAASASLLMGASTAPVGAALTAALTTSLAVAALNQEATALTGTASLGLATAALNSLPTALTAVLTASLSVTGGSPQFVQWGDSGGVATKASGTSWSLPSNVGAGHSVVLNILSEHGAPNDVAAVSGLGGTWVRGSSIAYGPNTVDMEVWYALGVTGGSKAITVTTASGAGYVAQASEWSGVAAVQAASSGGFGSAATSDAASWTPAQAGNVVIIQATSQTTAAHFTSAPSGWTDYDAGIYVWGNGIDAAYLVASGSVPLTPTWQMSASDFSGWTGIELTGGGVGDTVGVALAAAAIMQLVLSGQQAETESATAAVTASLSMTGTAGNSGYNLTALLAQLLLMAGQNQEAAPLSAVSGTTLSMAANPVELAQISAAAAASLAAVATNHETVAASAQLAEQLALATTQQQLIPLTSALALVLAVAASSTEVGQVTGSVAASLAVSGANQEAVVLAAALAEAMVMVGLNAEQAVLAATVAANLAVTAGNSGVRDLTAAITMGLAIQGNATLVHSLSTQIGLSLAVAALETDTVSLAAAIYAYLGYGASLIEITDYLELVIRSRDGRVSLTSRDGMMPVRSRDGIGEVDSA